MKILPVLILSVSVMLLSCDKKETVNTESAVEAPAVPATDTLAPVVDTVAVTAPQGGQTAAAPVAATAVPPTPAGQKPALNPPHGEPFHRCDIAVGAPIDSAPQQQAAPAPVVPQAAPQAGFNTTPISPAIAAPAATAAQNNTGPKPAVNPPHGQPWHRCDLQVGAPLT